MPSIHNSGATIAPPIILQADRVRRRIAASDAVAALVAELAYGPQRDASSWVWPTSVARITGEVCQ